MYQNNANIVGRKGENQVSRTLMLNQYMSHIYGEAFDDICFEVGSGSAEIDCLYISTIGIFVIEVKTWSGYIKGQLNDSKWTQIKIYGRTHETKSLVNPLIQNKGHVNVIKNLLNKDYPIYPLVVFTKNNAPKVSNEVINYNQLIPYIDSIKISGSTISEKDVDSLIAMFRLMKTKYGVSKQTHIANINRRHNLK